MKLLGKLQNVALKIIDWFLIEPKRLVRLVVLSVCSIVVFFQLWECAMKLLHPPISTASHFDLNRTMYYPAVTFCREPGFKVEVMEVNRCLTLRHVLITFLGIQSVIQPGNHIKLERLSVRKLFRLGLVRSGHLHQRPVFQPLHARRKSK